MDALFIALELAVGLVPCAPGVVSYRMYILMQLVLLGRLPELACAPCPVLRPFHLLL